VTHNFSQTQDTQLSTRSSTPQDDGDFLDHELFTNTKDSTHLLQTSLSTTKENHPFGDLISTPKTEGTIRIYFQNVNSIYKFQSWNTLQEAISSLKEFEVDIFGFAETNVKWNLRLKNQIQRIIQRYYKILQTTTSCSTERSRTVYQPGGTMTATSSKYTGRIRGIITDHSNMGRWSGFTLSSNFQHDLHIITVYQPVKSEGIHSTYKQQYSRLADMGHHNPNPRKQLLKDLQELIIKLNDQNDKTIILIDANNNLYTKDSLLPNFLSHTNLISLIPNTYDHPPTHSRGSRCIDYIFGSRSLVQHVTASGITAFYDRPYVHSDHRGLIIDIHELALFGANLNTIIPSIP
jgi:exonuclease III